MKLRDIRLKFGGGGGKKKRIFDGRGVIQGGGAKERNLLEILGEKLT